MSAPDQELRQQRQLVYWRLLAGVFGPNEQAKNVEQITKQIVEAHDLPELTTAQNLHVDALLQRYPELKDDFESIRKVCNPEAEDPTEGTAGISAGAQVEAGSNAGGTEGDAPLQPSDLRRSLAYSKLLLNTFGPNAMTP